MPNNRSGGGPSFQHRGPSGGDHQRGFGASGSMSGFSHLLQASGLNSLQPTQDFEVTRIRVCSPDMEEPKAKPILVGVFLMGDTNDELRLALHRAAWDLDPVLRDKVHFTFVDDPRVTGEHFHVFRKEAGIDTAMEEHEWQATEDVAAHIRRRENRAICESLGYDYNNELPLLVLMSPNHPNWRREVPMACTRKFSPDQIVSLLRYSAALCTKELDIDAPPSVDQLDMLSENISNYFEDALLGTSRSVGTESKSDEWIRINRSSWKIRIGGREIILSHSMGLLRISRLLENPNKLIDAFALLDRPGNHSTGQDFIDEEARTDYATRIVDAEESGNTTLASELTSELLKTSTDTGASKKLGDDARKACHTVQTSINRTIQDINLQDDKVGQYLTERLQIAFQSVFIPKTEDSIKLINNNL